MSLRLSKSSIDKFRSCPRCFWVEKKHGLKQPDGIRAGVPMGIDRVLKGHYDSNRQAKTIPPELSGKIPGGLYPGDRIGMADLRNWRHGLTAIVDGVELSTAMDDLLFNPATGLYNVFDAKSKARLTDEADTKKYYEVQGDSYNLALKANGYPTDDWAYFAYYSPLRVGSSAPSDEVDFRWNCQVIRIEASDERIKALVRAAAACLDSAIPEPNVRTVKGKKGDKVEGCPVCVYLMEHAALFAAGAKAAA